MTQRAADTDANSAGDAPSVDPPVAGVLLVYPTLRNPCCWCVTGALWVLPADIGRGWAHEGEHAFCWGDDGALQALLPALPPHVMCVTTAGDMLLPAHKHAGRLCQAIDAAATAGDSLLTVHGPLYRGHGCGLAHFWEAKATRWIGRVLLGEVAD